MKKTVKKSNVIKSRLNQVNKVINRLEVEIEKAVKKIRKQSEVSSRLIKRNLDDVIERLGATGIYSKATERTLDITSDLKKAADDLVARIRDVEVKVARPVLNDVRDQVTQIVTKLQDLEIIDAAKIQMVKGRKAVLTLLRIPSRDEVSSISRKLNQLEKKVETISRRKAA